MFLAMDKHASITVEHQLLNAITGRENLKCNFKLYIKYVPTCQFQQISVRQCYNRIIYIKNMQENINET